jgi:HdeA/HdeB family
MYRHRLVSAFACLLIVSFATAARATTTAAASPPKPARQIEIQKVTCRDLLAADVLDRSSVMMFYWGYVSARAGVSVIDTADMEARTSRVMQFCTQNQDKTVLAAIEASKSEK